MVVCCVFDRILVLGMRKVLEMNGFDPSRVARELVKQKKLDGLDNLYDVFRVIRENYDVSDVELLKVLRELREVHGLRFDSRKPDTDSDEPTNWVMPMPFR